MYFFQFRVHSLILGIAAPEMDWTCSPPPLSGLQEDVLKTVLYYLYTSCLPRGLSEETAKKCISKLGKLPGLANFSQLCETFLKNTALKQRKHHIKLLQQNNMLQLLRQSVNS